MNKRFFLALILTAIVIVATPLLFPKPAPGTRSATDTTSTHAVPATPTARSTTTPETLTPTVSAAAPVSTPMSNAGMAQTTSASLPVDSVTVGTGSSQLRFTSRGAAPLDATLDRFASRRPGGAQQRVHLTDPAGALARYRIALGRDTIALDTIVFRQQRGSGAVPSVIYSADVQGRPLQIEYAFNADTSASYLLHATVHAGTAPANSSLLLDLPRAFRSNEPDSVDDFNHLAFSFRPSRGDVTSVPFSKLDSTQARVEAAPINWVATRNKYFLVAFRPTTPFRSLAMLGAPRSGKIASRASATAVLPLASDGSAAFDMYVGPQEFERLQRLGGDLDQVNPYAGLLHGVVQPFATVVMRALLWMKRTTQLNYGWVLVLFGIFIRLILWPLNQSAMRTSLKMQRLQPELQALQKKHKDPQKQQEAIMKLYKEHGMSPLSPLMGCLPMLLPMPVLFALYYVFQNTIEFRGVPFLWLPDISLRDPYYITPLLMGISMFVMSWVGMRNSPPNPQAKMMSYMMPVMLTVVFLNFASGLNLYYAVQNIAALPQQWLLARERGKTSDGNAPALASSPGRA